uniref:Malonyl-CoA:ACP transacylase (MAT) domain-containing protein n=1 Tax=Romanomermis culicivorax TaxID=13658 RepID=A0A915JNV7_ROMCU
MAVVGMTWEETKARCPAGVVAACHNAKDTITISGDKDAVEKFTEQLKEEGVFTREVNSAGIAFHSDRMKLTAKSMKERLEKIVKEPRRRSAKWISTSVPESKWNTPLGQYCSPDYHVNNAVSPVLFYEALQHVPENAVLI